MQKRTAKMSKRTSIVARRAWEILRALMCARKGELCRNRAALTFNNFHKLVRKLIHHSTTGESRRGALLYGDHEFSFQNTPVVHVRMHRPAAALRFRLPQIPCIRPPQVDRDAWDEDEDDVMMWRENLNNDVRFLKDATEEMSEEEMSEEEMSEDSEEGIDERAEEFIAKFYEEMKLQRQISYV